MIPLAVPNLDGKEAAYLQDCITSTFVSSVGPFVDRFEAEIAMLSGSERAVVVSSGTVALKIALESLEIGSGHLVMVPSLTFIASPNAVRHTGADVWLVDADPRDWSLDINLCREILAAETDPHPDGRLHRATGKVVKAIMPVMIMGACVDLAGYVSIARENNVKVVVDAAAAIGATHGNGTPLAATGVDAVCYSFNGNKTVTCGGGGAVAAADAGLMKRIRHLTTTGRVGRDYDHDVVAYNYRMTNVQAALGAAQLERLGTFLERKRQIRDAYAALASRYPDLHPFPEPAFGTNAHWFSGMWYDGDNVAKCDAFRAHMVAAGVDLRMFWKPIHLQSPYANALCTKMPVAEPLWRRIFPLPCSTGLSESDLGHVIGAATEFWDSCRG